MHLGLGSEARGLFLESTTMHHATRFIRTIRAPWILLIAPLLCWGLMPARTIQAQATATQEKVKEQPKTIKKPDVIFVPTPQEVVNKMLELAEVKKGDVLYDLGCGDGRIVVTAAKKYGIKAIGFDIDPQRIKEARENVASNGVGDLVEIRHADIFETDLSAASVVTLYLLPELNVRLMPQL